jgi:transcriptional regulator with XRE-family HTH domain
MKDLGNQMRFERRELGLTLQNWADLSGTCSSMFQRVETGAKSLSVELLVEIANICRQPIDDLLKQQFMSRRHQSDLLSYSMPSR